MNSGETLPELPDACSAADDSKDTIRLRTLVGSYYRFLGWIDLISSVISLAIACWTGHVAITFGFVLWFWLGNGLKKGRASARKCAIGSSTMMMALLVVGLIFPTIGLRLAPWGIDLTHPAFLPLAVILLVVLAVPVSLLLGESGRRTFTANEEGEQAAGGTGDNARV